MEYGVRSTEEYTSAGSVLCFVSARSAVSLAGFALICFTLLYATTCATPNSWMFETPLASPLTLETEFDTEGSGREIGWIELIYCVEIITGFDLRAYSE